MSVSVKKIPGVESVNVSLTQGLTSIRLKPGNTVRLEQVRKAIRADAFTPEQARITAVGELNSVKGAILFKVAGTGETFPLAPALHTAWDRQLGRTLLVSGLIAAPASEAGPGTLQITEITEEAAGAK